MPNENCPLCKPVITTSSNSSTFTIQLGKGGFFTTTATYTPLVCTCTQPCGALACPRSIKLSTDATVPPSSGIYKE